jgi:hypothetical protein
MSCPGRSKFDRHLSFSGERGLLDTRHKLLTRNALSLEAGTKRALLSVAYSFSEACIKAPAIRRHALVARNLSMASPTFLSTLLKKWSVPVCLRSHFGSLSAQQWGVAFVSFVCNYRLRSKRVSWLSGCNRKGERLANVARRSQEVLRLARHLEVHALCYEKTFLFPVSGLEK